MTVKDLKDKHDAFPDDMEVFMAEVETGFQYTTVEQVRMERINFSEGPWQQSARNG